MTLVLALKARDGAVLVADGQATAGRGVPTRSPAEKLGCLHGRIGYGCAGSAGLQQRLARKLNSEITAKDCQLPITELRPKLMAVVNAIQHAASSEYTRRDLVSQAPGIEVLFGGVSTEDSWVYEISADGEDQVHDTAEAIGAGRHFAAYALMSADHYGLHARDLAQVRLLGYRAVNDAIRTDAATLGEPIAVVEVTAAGARQLGDEEIEVLKSGLTIWQGHEREIFGKMPPGH